MAGFWDKVKKGAQEAGEKAAQLAKIAKIQTEITGLGSSRKEKLIALGEKTYALYKDGKLSSNVQDEIKEFLAAIEEIEKKIDDKKKEIEKIKAEMNEKKEDVEETEKETVSEAKKGAEETNEKVEEKAEEAKEEVSKPEQTEKTKQGGTDEEK
jgi:chromosome segregation ATPase